MEHVAILWWLIVPFYYAMCSYPEDIYTYFSRYFSCGIKTANFYYVILKRAIQLYIYISTVNSNLEVCFSKSLDNDVVVSKKTWKLAWCYRLNNEICWDRFRFSFNSPNTKIIIQSNLIWGGVVPVKTIILTVPQIISLRMLFEKELYSKFYLFMWVHYILTSAVSFHLFHLSAPELLNYSVRVSLPERNFAGTREMRTTIYNRINPHFPAFPYSLRVKIPPSPT